MNEQTTTQSTPEHEQTLRAVKRCEWAGVACLFALPILIVSTGSYNIDLHRLMGLPSHLEAYVGAAFFGSWLLAGFGLLLPLLVCAGIWLSLRIGEMVRQVLG